MKNELIESVAKVCPEPTPAFRLRQGYGGQVGHPSAGGDIKKFKDKRL